MTRKDLANITSDFTREQYKMHRSLAPVEYVMPEHFDHPIQAGDAE